LSIKSRLPLACEAAKEKRWLLRYYFAVMPLALNRAANLKGIEPEQLIARASVRAVACRHERAKTRERNRRLDRCVTGCITHEKLPGAPGVPAGISPQPSETNFRSLDTRARKRPPRLFLFRQTTPASIEPTNPADLPRCAAADARTNQRTNGRPANRVCTPASRVTRSPRLPLPVNVRL